MPNRVLIANRGEIALRILRACRILGKETVGIFTEVDRNLEHLKYVTKQVRVKSYLDIDDVVMAGKTTDCDSVHPGYGLLAENAEFAEKICAAGMVFVGPSSEHIALLGDKIRAREVFQALAIAPIPGSQGAVESAAEIKAVAKQIGYPLVIKAAFGGGGRGIRAVTGERDLEEILQLSRGEAGLSFGKDEVFVEKLVQSARHIEVQVFGDGQGNCVHLGTRDCSIQRRYQKLIEEAPAPNIPEHAISDLTDRVTAAVAQLRYQNAATFEFLYVDNRFYFLEINTRLQVEHPVSEVVTGRDFVTTQFRIADEGQVPFRQSDVQIQGHGIELRILAEDVTGRPSPGKVLTLHMPSGPGVRVDSHLYVGYRVPHQYDSLLAKFVISAEDRTTAITRARQALTEFKISGVDTNMLRLKEIIEHPDFVAVNIDTHWKPS